MLLKQKYEWNEPTVAHLPISMTGFLRQELCVPMQATIMFLLCYEWDF